MEKEVLDCQIRIVREKGKPEVEVTPLWETADKISFKVSKVEDDSFVLSWNPKGKDAKKRNQ